MNLINLKTKQINVIKFISINLLSYSFIIKKYNTFNSIVVTQIHIKLL